MSVTAVMNGVRCCICTVISLLLAATLIVGSSAAGAAAMGSDSTARLRQDVAQACQPAMIADLSSASCDANDDAPARQKGCPMLGICVNIGSSVTHCGLVAVTDSPDFEEDGATAATIVFRQSAVRATGLPGEAVFHPPIL